MIRLQRSACTLLVALSLSPMADAIAQQPPPTKPARSAAKSAQAELETKAIDLLRAMGGALTTANSMSFTAVTTYESPSSVGPALAYGTISEVLLQRPDRLRVLTLGDGPASEFSYDGKTITAFAPAENLVAVAPAPPTIDAMLKQAFDNAAIYFPFADL
ncbi:DUF2092 domain-containing protein, partial [Variovorax sp. M-6]|uniref:DUF2092 domain-containing protein n=1 Tax=Variovorax sp. M-6 TaxID=3233041 RepID=UPI003F99B215